MVPFWGIKKESNEPVDFEVKYLTKIGIDTNYVFRLKRQWVDSLSIKKYALNTYKLKTGGRAGAVQIRMYDKTGQFIYGWEQCFGSLNHFDIFTTVPISSKYSYLPINKDLNLWNDLNLFEIDAGTRKLLSTEIQNHSYTIVVYWAAWVGYFSKNTLKEVNSYVKSHKKENILFLKLNTATYETDK
jgi:hypothetical protein